MNRIIDSNTNYSDLLCYKKTVVIYDITHHFCKRFVEPRDRTYDQMIQAARSGKQNIVEGTIDKASSYEMCLKLLNVARGSLKELLEDYKDYLRVNGHKRVPCLPSHFIRPLAVPIFVGVFVFFIPFCIRNNS